MLYCAINELDHFQYHDAEVKEIALTNMGMVWSVAAINATTENTQNMNPKDVCVEKATVTFDNISIKSIVFSAYTVHDSKGNLIEDVKAITAKPEEYSEILRKSTDSYCFIYGMEDLTQNPDDTYEACFNIDGGSGSYYFTFSFSSSTVEWDEYSGEAWYEHPKWKKQQ
jgi:hypothetical protein